MTAATQLLEKICASGMNLSKEHADDTERTPFAGVRLPDDGRVFSVRDDEVRSWIAALCWREFHTVASKTTIVSIITTLEGLALYSEKSR